MHNSDGKKRYMHNSDAQNRVRSKKVIIPRVVVVHMMEHSDNLSYWE